MIVCVMSCEFSRQENMCIAQFLDDFNMKPYKGEDLDCKTHIRMYDYEGTLFAVQGNHCCDYAPFMIYDCDGEEFCFTSVGPCYFQESVDMGIIGIEK